MSFTKYQHLERLGADEVEGILDGIVYIYPKIDGTNASVWFDGKIRFGSRNRELSLESDNAGFMAWGVNSPELVGFFHKFPHLILYGEWLVPHSLKTYDENAWRKFYVFDVVSRVEGDYMFYVHYDNYFRTLQECGLEVIPPIAVIKNPKEEDIFRLLEKNTYLIQDGKGMGEGIVIKNYDYKNKYGRVTWAKVITNEFKKVHHLEMGAPLVNGTLLDEERIISDYVTEDFVLKEKAKIELEHGEWRSNLIPELLGRVWHCLVTEETWNFVKRYKNPKVNFRLLQSLCIKKTKEVIGL